jgi:hypothetical protein
MNPYLEDPVLWPGVHASLITEIRSAINGELPTGYFADIEERINVYDEDDSFRGDFIPDVTVLHDERQHGGRSAADEASVGVATLSAPIQAPITIHEEAVERRLVIRSLPHHHVVTVIEVLSPSNKTRGSASRRQYLEKRDELLATDAHFVEIDLLRAGHRVPAPVSSRTYYYSVAVSRVDRRPIADWWLIDLTQPLPTVPIPLRRGDAEIMLNLQSVLHEVYDRGGYRRAVNYEQPPPLPELSPEQSEWLQNCLRQPA